MNATAHQRCRRTISTLLSRRKALLLIVLAGVSAPFSVQFRTRPRSSGTTLGPGPGLREKLPFRPPGGDFSPLHVDRSKRNVQGQLHLEADRDYILIFDTVMTKRLRVIGGRHIKIIGCEFRIDSDNVNVALPVTDPARFDDNSGLEFSGQSGTVFIEGLWVHGRYATDSIRVAPPSSETNFVIQNSRLDCDRVITGLSTSDGFLHTDGFQCWGGLKSLAMVNVTISNPYQGGMIGDGALTGVWGKTYLERVNFRPGIRAGQVNKLVNVVADAQLLRGPIIVRDDVYYAPAPGVTWDNRFARPRRPYNGGAFYSNFNVGGAGGTEWAEFLPRSAPQISSATNGVGQPIRIRRGLPPTGDYATDPTNSPGLTYRSPGYN